MNTVTFTVPGPSVPEQKLNVRMGKFARRVDTHAAAAQKVRVYSRAIEAMAGRLPLQGPVSLDVQVTLLRPKSAPKKRVYPATRPDCSNYVKLAEDALNGVVFEDDKQVVDLTASKRYGEHPGTTITVTALEAEPAFEESGAIQEELWQEDEGSC